MAPAPITARALGSATDCSSTAISAAAPQGAHGGVVGLEKFFLARNERRRARPFRHPAPQQQALRLLQRFARRDLLGRGGARRFELAGHDDERDNATTARSSTAAPASYQSIWRALSTRRSVNGVSVAGAGLSDGEFITAESPP